MMFRNFFRLTSLAFFLLLLASKLVVVHPATASDTPADASSSALYSADWRATGPPGGDVRALVIDPKDPSRFYFGTLDGQIYTSTDGARTWRLLHNFNIPGLYVDHILVDPRNSDTLYVGA